MPEEQKASRVHGVFSSVAARYDLMNDLMSARIHRLWKEALVDRLAPRPGLRLLDVAGGTGDIAFRVLDRVGGAASVTVCDLTQKMLDEGRRRAEAGRIEGIDWVCGDAMALPFEDAKLRCLHHRLRHPERDPHRGRSGRGPPRSASLAGGSYASNSAACRCRPCDGPMTVIPSM